MILVTFSSYSAHSQSPDREIEERLHKIYIDNYSKPVLDSDWFKIVEGINEQVYMVKRGDTLWGISKIYFGDGHYWSKLWSVNQSITNPHKILVSDNLHFKSGSMISAPSISVAPGSATDADGVPVEPVLTEEGETPVSSKAPVSEEYGEIHPFFKNAPPFIPQRVNQVTVEARPELTFKSAIRLNQEIMSRMPEILGTVKSVGEDRMATGENNIVLITAPAPLTIGAIMTVQDAEFGRLKEGYFVKTLGTIRILRGIGNGMFEAEVIEQFDGILVGSAVTGHIVPNVSLEVEGEPVSSHVSVIKSTNKTFWYNGDVIFLEINKSAINVGDIVNMNNKFDKGVDFFYHVGLIKIVSVSPPYATGIVIYSNSTINDDSISQP